MKDEKGNVNRQLFNALTIFAHESNAHAVGNMAGAPLNEDADHLKYFGLSKDSQAGKNMLNDIYPNFSDISKDSKAYSDMSEIYKAMGGKGSLESYMNPKDKK